MAQVNVYGTLRLVTGRKTIPVDLPAGATLGDYLAAVAHHYPLLRQNMLDDHNKLRKDMPVFLNGRNPRLLPNYMTRVLQPGDVLSLFSPISSGRMNVEVLRRPASESKGGK